jgi:hypothetical protein
MKMHCKPTQRRPLGHHALNGLLARRQRLRKRIAMAAAMFLSAGLLLAGLES